MELAELQLMLEKVPHCTFATMDTTTFPVKGLRKVTTGTRALLFTNTQGVSGYEEIVKRRLIEAGKDPRNFVLGDLPWGERIPDTPLITCRGNIYLQTIVIEPGHSRAFTGLHEVDLNDFVKPRRTNQGLPAPDEVIVSTYNIQNIDRIMLLGEDTVKILTDQGLVPMT